MFKIHIPGGLSMRNVLRLLAATSLGLMLTLAYGCGDSGPAERAGERIDDAVDEAQDLFEPAGPAERAGEKIDDAVDEVTE